VSLRYRLLYRLGITPWDQDHVPSELAALVEGPAALPAGAALDIGCGTGTQSVYLAQHGWRVTGVDAIPRALAQAQRRAEVAAVGVRWLAADVSQLDSLGLDGGFELLHDRGCFHDLSDGVRELYVHGVSSLAAPGATLLLMAFAPSARRPGAPSGASEEEIQRRFGAHWELLSLQNDSGPDPPGPMRHVPRLWYRLRRRSRP
jgi:SAM-dependent methyltransferase